jgi:hypothetical protein
MREGVNPLVHVRYLIVAILFLITMPTVLADDLIPDGISAPINKTLLRDDGTDQSPITVDVYNQTPAGRVPLAGLQVEFIMDNTNLGHFSQSTNTTSGQGRAETTFLAGTTTGATQLFARVYYTAGGTQQSKEFELGKVYVQGSPDDIQLSSINKEWVVAGGTDNSIITLNVTKDGNPVPQLPVSLSIAESEMGSLSQISSSRTNDNGIVTARFTSSTKSGDANITARVTYENGGDVEWFDTFYLQKVDHDTPYKISTYDLIYEVTVGTDTNISINLSDRWNNPVDNRNVVETVYFEVGSSSMQGTGDPNSIPAGFWNESTYMGTSVYIPVNNTGTATATLRMDTRPGAHVVYVKPFNTAIPGEYFTIQGVADGEPFDLIQEIDPPSLQVPANQDYLFTITYTLKDRWENNLVNHGILFETSHDEREVIYTNHLGWAKRTYGPSGYTGSIDISAKPLENMSIVRTATLHFINTTAVDMVLTASPSTMPSGDVPVSSSVSVVAKVVDIMGNPVKDIPIQFDIIHGTYPVAQVKEPSFSESVGLDTKNVLTNSGGQAIVQFWPGHFETNESKSLPEYDPQATAGCTVRATWVNEAGIPITRERYLEWKNYPWISAKTSATPLQVAVNDTVDVTVQIIGDGWALQPKPIDVILVIDTSGSMGGSAYSTRMQPAKDAAKNFVNSMNMSKDNIGVVAFSSDAVLVQGLTNNSASLNSAIDSLEPIGATNLRKALYVAIQNLKANGRDNAVKAVVAMTDGDWNAHGSPLAKGIGFPDTDTKLSAYDSSHYDQGVPLSAFPWGCTAAAGYTFNPGPCGVRDTSGGTTTYYEGYEWYSDLVDPKGTLSDEKYWKRGYAPGYHDWENEWQKGWVCMDGQNTNQNMAVYALSGSQNRHVRLYSIGFAQTLNTNVVSDLTTLSTSTGGWYSWAGNEEALNSLYTQIAGELKEEAGVDTTMEISYENVEIESTYPGGEVFDYVPVEGKSTYIRSYYLNGTPIGSPSTRNDISSWTAENKYTLKFNIGTIKLYQVWEATYRLKVKKPGNINLFEDTAISFKSADDIEQNIHLPSVFISSAYNLTNATLSTPELELSDISETEITDYIREWTWTRTYTGEGNLTERYWISVDGGKQWTQIDEKVFDAEYVRDNPVGTYRLDLRTIENGVNYADQIKFRVEAMAFGTRSPVRTEIDTGGREEREGVFIKLF